MKCSSVVSTSCVDASLQYHLARCAVPAIEVARMLLNGAYLLFRCALCVTQNACNVPVRLTMSIPAWVPIPKKTLEKQGSESLQKMIDSDVGPLVEEFRDKLVAWAEKSRWVRPSTFYRPHSACCPSAKITCPALLPPSPTHQHRREAGHAHLNAARCQSVSCGVHAGNGGPRGLPGHIIPA